MNIQSAAVTRVEPLALQEFFTLAGVQDRFDYASKILVTPEGREDLTPYPHQIGDLNQALTNERFGLFNQCGTGKTLPIQAYCLYQAGLGNRVVVLMPPILLLQFTESLARDFPGYETFFRLHILNEGPKKRAELFAQWRADDSWPDLMLMSYQQFSKLPRAKKDNETGEILRPPDPDDYISGVLKKHGYSVLIGDEAQALKSTASNAHKTVASFLGTKGDSACILATGTPAPNTLLDALGMIQLLTPGKYSSKRSFERHHCIYKEGSGGFSVLVGFKNKLLITANLYANARRITKSQVFSTTQPRVQEVDVHLSRKHKELYKRLVHERFLELPDGNIVNAIQAQALRQKCLQIIAAPQFFTDEKFENAVITMTDQLLDSIGVQEEKVILFAHYKRTVESLASYYEKLNPAVVYGGHSNNNKEKDKFLHDPSCRLLIANVISAGAGLNLHKVCSNAIFVEAVSVPGYFIQAMERMRAGLPSQPKVVSVYILKALGTLAPKLTKSMLSKERDNLSVLMDRESLLSELLGV